MLLVPFFKKAGGHFHSRIGRRPGLHFAPVRGGRFRFHNHEFGKRVGPQRQERDHDQNDQKDAPRANTAERIV